MSKKRDNEQVSRLIAENYQLKTERNSLIDDIDWQQKKIERLEEEKEDMLLEREYYNNRYKDTIRICKELEHENKALRLQSNTYFDEWQNEKLTSQGLREQCKEYAQDVSKYLNLLSEISQHIGNKPSSSTYKYFRAKLDGVGIKEGE